ncbi:hypothetical protein STANM309S_06082 [Streptomyces tanashiensis]
MDVDRLLPTPEAADLIALTREIADKELSPRVDEHEAAETYPEGLFATLGEAGLLGLPYPEEYGGGGQPYEVYLQVLEELAARWAAVGRRTSVHTLACHPLAHLRHAGAEGTMRLPAMLEGRTIGGVQPLRAAGRLRRRRPLLQGRASGRRQRLTASPAPRPGSPTAARPASTPSSPPAPAR